MSAQPPRLPAPGRHERPWPWLRAIPGGCRLPVRQSRLQPIVPRPGQGNPRANRRAHPARLRHLKVSRQRHRARRPARTRPDRALAPRRDPAPGPPPSGARWHPARAQALDRRDRHPPPHQRLAAPRGALSDRRSGHDPGRRTALSQRRDHRRAFLRKRPGAPDRDLLRRPGLRRRGRRPRDRRPLSAPALRLTGLWTDRRDLDDHGYPAQQPARDLQQASARCAVRHYRLTPRIAAPAGDVPPRRRTRRR